MLMVSDIEVGWNMLEPGMTILGGFLGMNSPLCSCAVSRFLGVSEKGSTGKPNARANPPGSILIIFP